MRPKRRLIVAFATVFAVGGSSLVLHADTLSVGSASVSVGNTFVVPVEVSSASDLYAFQFDVSFDANVLQLESVTEGSFLPTAGPTFFIPGTIDNTAGTAAFNADTLIGAVPGAAGDGTLATLDFQAVSNGASTVTLSNIILLDSNLNDISFTSSGGDMVVGSAVPEPRTDWLVTFGLVCCFLFWRPRPDTNL